MTSDIQLFLALKVALTLDTSGGLWPPANQGDNQIAANLANVDLTKWDVAYVDKFTLAAAGAKTVDLRNFTDLFGVAGRLMNRVFLMAVQVDGLAGAKFRAVPGAANGLVWYFTELDLLPGDTHVKTCLPTDIVGTPTDATHKTIDFTNPGTVDMTATVIILGGS